MLDKFSNLFNVSVMDLHSVIQNAFGTKGKREPNRIAQELKRIERDISYTKNLASQFADGSNEKKFFEERIRKLNKDAKESELELTERIIDETISKQEGFFQKVKDTIHGESGLISKIASIGVWKATAGVYGGAFSMVSGNLATISELSAETGFNTHGILEDYIRLTSLTAELEANGRKITSSVAEQLPILIEMRKSFGVIEVASLKTLNTIASFPRTLNLSSKESLEFLETLKDINLEGIAFNTNLIKTMAILGDNNAIGFRQIMEDVKSNTEFFATHSGQGNMNLLRSTILARRLSTDIGTIGSVLEGFTNVESLMEKQMKLSMFTGRQLNFIEAATHQFFGRTEEGMRSLLEQLASVDDATFNFPFVRKQFAEQLGVSVDKVNELRKASKNLNSEAALLNMNYQAGLDDFNVRIMSFGFTGLRQQFVRDVVNPLNNTFSQYTREVQTMYNVVGKVTSSMGHVVKSFVDATGLFGMAAIPILVAGLKLLQPSFALDLQRNTYLAAIVARLNADIGGFTGWWHGKTKGVGGKVMERRQIVGKGLGAIGTVGSVIAGYKMGSQDQKKGEFSLGTLLTTALSGAGSGAMVLGGFGVHGALIGALIGGALSAGSYLAGNLAGNKMATGGIVTKPLKTWVGEGDKKEAVIPLESQKGKEMLSMNLSDDSIEKLARKLTEKKVKVGIQLFDDKGKAMDERFYKFVSGSKSALNN